MQPFMKMKKKMGMTESTRQVLNKAIDLLHRLSNNKISEDVAKRELATTLSAHFLAEGGVEAQKKIRLQMVLEEANDVVTELHKGKIPLYEAIMLINRIVVTNMNKEPPPVPENRLSPSYTEEAQLRPKLPPYQEDMEFISQEFDISGDQKERNLQARFMQKIEEKEEALPPKQSEEDVILLMNRVLMNKKQLEEAISDLNGTLYAAGFELRPIGK